MNKLLLLSVLLTSIVVAQEVEVDCLIVKDENSIICKYTQDRSLEDRMVKIHWIDPQGKISRQRDINFPAGHASIYDFRYLEGRISGTWIFKIIDDAKEYKTTFDLN